MNETKRFKYIGKRVVRFFEVILDQFWINRKVRSRSFKKKKKKCKKENSSLYTRSYGGWVRINLVTRGYDYGPKVN